MTFKVSAVSAVKVTMAWLTVVAVLHAEELNMPGPWIPYLEDGNYNNPVIHADYSVPDVVRVGSDYYMTSSSFNCTPGLQILHSRDLVNWKIIGKVFDQGGWLAIPDEQESWFLHFQDKGPYGRIVHLQPMEWKNDWPVIGDDDVVSLVLNSIMGEKAKAIQCKGTAGLNRITVHAIGSADGTCLYEITTAREKIGKGIPGFSTITL